MVDLRGLIKLLAKAKDQKTKKTGNRLLDVYSTPPDLPFGFGAGVGVIPMREPPSDKKRYVPGVEMGVEF